MRDAGRIVSFLAVGRCVSVRKEILLSPKAEFNLKRTSFKINNIETIKNTLLLKGSLDKNP